MAIQVRHQRSRRQQRGAALRLRPSGMTASVSRRRIVRHAVGGCRGRTLRGSEDPDRPRGGRAGAAASGGARSGWRSRRSAPACEPPNGSRRHLWSSGPGVRSSTRHRSSGLGTFRSRDGSYLRWALEGPLALC
jgi:hypothetical protein